MADNTELAERLRALFPQFPQDLRDEMARKGVVKEFAPGDTIVRTGQYFRSSLIVLDGRLKLYRDGAEGDAFFLYFLEPGKACALSMLCTLQSQTSEVKAVADEPTRVLMLPIELLDSLMLTHRQWYQFVLENYRERLEELLLLVDHVAFRSMDERLEFYLQRQTEALGSRLLNTTHEQIAADLNSSRVVISRLLKQMEHDGRVRLHRNQIELL